MRKIGCALLAVTFSVVNIRAQQVRVPAPHKPVTPKIANPEPPGTPIPRSLVGGFWMVGPDLRASIHLSNDMITDPITVIPILHFSTGEELKLPRVNLDPSGIAVISINDALKEANMLPTGFLFGYVEVQYSWAWDAICASIKNIDIAHSLIFIYTMEPLVKPTSPAFHPTAALMQDNILEGIWWKQEQGVTGFIAFSNILDRPASAKIILSDDANNPIASHSVKVPSHGAALVDLTEIETALGSQGGIRITYDGPSDGLQINGGLEDPAVGFSARVPLHFPPILSAQHATVSYSALDMMKGAADPNLSFPAGTMFTPYSIVRNISDQPLTLTPTIWWMVGIVPHSARLSTVNLAPYHTMNLNVPELLKQGNLKDFTGTFNLELESDGQSRALLEAAGSVDQSNTYVFEVSPKAAMESVAKTLSYWSTGNGDNTMVTLWNPADEPQSLVFVLHFAGGDGHYSVPIYLNARETRSFNISSIINNPAADADGNLIPPGTHEGRAEIMGSKGENERILVAIESGVYNVQKATCGNTYCVSCDGAVSSSILPSPSSVSQGGTTNVTFTVKYKSGASYDDTSVAAWSSSNTSVATVNSGTVTGVGVGAADLFADETDIPDYFYHCYQASMDMSCPITTGQSGTAPEQTLPTVSIKGPNFVSMAKSGTPGAVNTIQLTAAGNPTGGTYSWSTSSNVVSLTNPTSATVTVQSQSIGNANVTVKYTINNQSASAAQPVGVLQPTSLRPLPNTATIQCPQSYQTQELITQYTLLGQNSLALPVADIPVVESFAPISNNCSGVANVPNASTWTTLDTGSLNAPDTQAMCSSSCLPANSSGQPQGSCTYKFTQTFTANGYPVQTKTITMTCPGPPTQQ